MQDKLTAPSAMAATKIEPVSKRATMFATEAAIMPHLGMGDSISILGSAPWPDMPWWQRIAPSTFFVLLSAAVAIFFLAHELAIAGHLGFPLDSSWLRVAYAKNFFHDLAFELAPGVESPAPTSPFWIVVLSLTLNIFRDPILSGKLLGTIFLFLTGYYAFRLLRALQLDYTVALLAGVMIITSQALTWTELSGLESTLSAALVTGALWWHFSHPGKVPEWLHFFVTGAIFALGTLTRPEISVIFLILVLWHVLRRDQNTLLHIVMLVLGFCIVLFPVALTNFAVSGSFVPATFRGSIEEHSIVRVIWHGNITGIFSSTTHSFTGIWAALRDIYFSENPMWVIAILVALASRFRRKMAHPHSMHNADALFSLASLILASYPFLHTLFLGNADSFGSHQRLVSFMIPIYLISGVLSVRICVRNELFRSITPKKAIILFSVVSTVVGIIYILGAAPHQDTSITTPIQLGLLIFFSVVLFVAAVRYAKLPLFQKEVPHEVTEAERLETHFTIPADGMEEWSDLQLSFPARIVLHSLLLLLLAWNLAVLPRAANDFAIAVAQTNHLRSQAAGAIWEP